MCTKEEMWCTEGRCLAKNFICDGISDCLMAMDEIDCGK